MRKGTISVAGTVVSLCGVIWAAQHSPWLSFLNAIFAVLQVIVAWQHIGSK